MSDIVEIIDLTSPGPSIREPPDAGASEQASGPSSLPSEQNPPTPDAQAHKKKKRRTKRSSVGANTDADTPRESRAASAEREDRTTEPRSKRKRGGEEEPAEDRLEYATRQVRRRERRERRREEREQAEQEVEREVPDEDLFFVDLAPAPISSTIISDPATTEASDPATEIETTTKLLVPAHVTVLGSTPVDIIQPLALEEGEEDEDFINYLDYEDTRQMQRYFDEAPDKAAALNRTVCKNCGAEGEHKTSACTVMICLTCGVRNEHSTRSCPISKVCFTCGMKGHINANCPNRRTARALQSSRQLECDRCASSNHKTNECPTVWRQYEYFTIEEQINTVTARLSKKDLKVGQGGEGYVADDEWCYYCGQCGHWGDDCQDMDRPPPEHSAFSRYNVASGPFYDPGNERKASTSRSRTRDWENGEDISGWGKGAPDHVGKQGRMKSRAALERQMQDVEDDVDDWFGGTARRTANNSIQGGPSQRPPSLPQKPASKGFVFGKSTGSGRQYAPPANNPPPRLLDRLGGEDRRDSYDSRSRSSHHGTSGGGNDSRRRRDDRSSSSRYPDRRRYDSGPRYRGGYVAR